MKAIRVVILGAMFFLTQALFAANLVIEDFSSTPINPVLQNASDGQIIGGQYRMMVTQTDTGRTLERVRINQEGVTYLSAKVTLSSDSDTTGGSRIRGRITHYLGNVDFNTGDPLIDGAKGNVWTALTIERRSDGSFRAHAYAEKVIDSEYLLPADPLFSQTLSPTISYDQQFELAIEIVGTTVNYIIDGNTEFSFDLTDDSTYPVLTGNIYPVTHFTNGLALPQFQARVQDAPGTAVVLFDDITTNSLPCTDLSKPLCIFQNIEVRKQSFCDSVRHDHTSNNHSIANLFGGYTLQIPANSDLNPLINNACHPMPY